jgi:ubiquinone/menaquinone biosynthesis C-methylase UbiE
METDSRRATVVGELDTQRGSATATQVRDYWNAHPLTVDRVPYAVGSPESIEAIYERWKEGIDEHRLRFLDLCRGKRILEVGCGIGVDARWLIENGIDYRGVDYSFRSLQLCRKMLDAANLRCDWVNGDAAALPFADQAFDLVFAVGVLHHVPDMERACREVVRVAKPGATVRVMLYNRHSYHYALVNYVVRPLIWLMTRVPGLSNLAALLPAKFRHLYAIAKRDGFDRQRILNSSTDTSYPGETNFNPLSRFLTEREVRVLFDDLEDFDFFRMNLSHFPVPFVRKLVERRLGFFLTFTAHKRRIGGLAERG